MTTLLLPEAIVLSACGGGCDTASMSRFARAFNSNYKSFINNARQPARHVMTTYTPRQQGRHSFRPVERFCNDYGQASGLCHPISHHGGAERYVREAILNTTDPAFYESHTLCTDLQG